MRTEYNRPFTMASLVMAGYRCFFLLLLLRRTFALATFANVTLTADNGDLSVVIFLPKGIKPGEPTYYESSRFDHGSMIGKIERKTLNQHGEKETHVLYGVKQWRNPHDPYWPESGVGLASEFGVGGDGNYCNYRCGWYQVNEVTNGVLGYQTAKNGESFLKIGVGELVKGSCPACDSTDGYKFNSPYKFARTPEWTLEENAETNSIVLEHVAVLDENGYKLRKEIRLNDGELLVTTSLTNIGRVWFATAWYSHHFFTCDNLPVAKGVGAELDLTGTAGAYEEPGTWSWSTPLETHATVQANDDRVSVEMKRGLDRDVRIKTEFVKDESSHGSFSLHGCGTSIAESIPEVGTEGGVTMYAFNLYIESSTFSPEPQIYMHLWPGQSTSWTQRLEFSDYNPQPEPILGARLGLAALASSESTAVAPQSGFLLFALSGSTLALAIHWVWRRRREHNYVSIPDH